MPSAQEETPKWAYGTNPTKSKTVKVVSKVVKYIIFKSRILIIQYMVLTYKFCRSSVLYLRKRPKLKIKGHSYLNKAMIPWLRHQESRIVMVVSNGSVTSM